MSNAIQVLYPNANAGAANLGRTPMTEVQRSSLVAEMIFGRDLATSTLNSAVSPPSYGSVVGTPTYGDHNAAVDASDYILTGMAETAAITCMVVLAPGASTPGDVYVSTGVNQVGSGAGLNFFDNTGTVVLQSQTSAGSTSGLSLTGGFAPSIPLTSYRALCCRMDQLATPTFKVDEFMGGVKTQSASQTQTGVRVLGTNGIKIGSIGTTALASAFNVCAYLQWSMDLADSDLLQAYTDVRVYLAAMNKAT